MAEIINTSSVKQTNVLVPKLYILNSQLCILASKFYKAGLPIFINKGSQNPYLEDPRENHEFKW